MDKEKMLFMSNLASAIQAARMVILNNIMEVDPDAKDRELQLFCVGIVNDMFKMESQASELLIKYGSNGALDDETFK